MSCIFLFILMFWNYLCNMKITFGTPLHSHSQHDAVANVQNSMEFTLSKKADLNVLNITEGANANESFLRTIAMHIQRNKTLSETGEKETYQDLAAAYAVKVTKSSESSFRFPTNGYHSFKLRKEKLRKMYRRSLKTTNNFILSNKTVISNESRTYFELETTNKTSIKYPLPGDQEVKTTALKTLNIGGLFELSNTPFASNGHSELAAAKLAIKQVNEKQLLPGYKLEMVYNDTQCDPGVGSDTFYDMVYRKPQLLMVIGSACSEVTKTVGQVVPYWNLTLVSFGSTSPALSKRKNYPTFYRLASADSSHNEARKAFIQHFHWDTVVTLHQDQELFALAMNDMYKVFENANITLKATQTFRGIDGISTQLLKLKEIDARIIIGSFQEDAARQVFCQAYHLGLYGKKYVWMLLGWYTDQFWTKGNDTNCTHAQLSEALDGYFSVDSLTRMVGQQVSDSGMTNEDFQNEYQAFTGTKPQSPYAAQTYDTVWTVVKTINETIKRHLRKTIISQNISNPSVEDFTYKNGKNLTNEMLKIMGNLEFLGVSGPISFVGSDRQGISSFSQNQNGIRKTVGLYASENGTVNFNCLDCCKIIWQGEKVPVDKYMEIFFVHVIDRSAFAVASVFCIMGMIMAVIFLTFNVYYRKLKFIKLSSPKLNNVAVLGCIIIYLAVVFLGFDDSIMENSWYLFTCTTRAFLFSAGFTLSFGSMFVKTYRVHYICTKTTTGLVKRNLLKDRQLLAIVGGLLALDCAIMVVWVIVDPMHRGIRNFTKQTSEEDSDVLYVPQISRCYSVHQDYFTGVFYAYKGLLLLFGVYMAWATRHVKIPALNDSKYIGLNVYNVVIMSALTVALSSLLSEQPTLEYAIVSSLLIISTTAMLCLLFLPKVHKIMCSGDSNHSVVASSGLRMEARTRRFCSNAFMERQELHYRAEVQNTAYKREVVELDKDLYTLERALELTGQQFYDELANLLPQIQNKREPTVKIELSDVEITTDFNATVMTGIDEDDIDKDSGLSSTSTPRPTQNSATSCNHLDSVSLTQKIKTQKLINSYEKDNFDSNTNDRIRLLLEDRRTKEDLGIFNNQVVVIKSKPFVQFKKTDSVLEMETILSKENNQSFKTEDKKNNTRELSKLDTLGDLLSWDTRTDKGRQNVGNASCQTDKYFSSRDQAFLIKRPPLPLGVEKGAITDRTPRTKEQEINSIKRRIKLKKFQEDLRKIEQNLYSSKCNDVTENTWV